MRVLVTGSAGHLGEALVRHLSDGADEVLGLDIRPSPFTHRVGSIADRAFVDRCMQGVDIVYHSATLHKPHVVTHSKQQFVDTNIAGTLALLEAASAVGVKAFVFTSTTSVFGDALRPPLDQPAAWVTEQVQPIARNVYGVTKLAAEGLCQLFHRNHGLDCIVLRTSRFFPEQDDSRDVRDAYAPENANANEFLFRRVDLSDVVDAHLLAAQRARQIGFGTYIVSATSPFQATDLARLRNHPAQVVAQYYPQFSALYGECGWRMFEAIDRVYINDAARAALGWEPRYNFDHILDCLTRKVDPRSELARAVGTKYYHAERFADGPYPT